METLIHDIRFAFRSFAKTPASIVVAVVTLALGIGATTAMFSVIHSTLLRALPFPDPEELVMVYLTRSEAGSRMDRFRWSHPEAQMLTRSVSKLSEIASFASGNVNLTGVDVPLRIDSEIAKFCDRSFLK